MNKPHLTLHSCNQALSRSNAALGLGAPHAPTLLSAISARLTTSITLGLALALALLPLIMSERSALLGANNACPLSPVLSLLHYELGWEGAPSKDELKESLTTATALSQMGIFLLAGWLSGAVLGYRRALRALWHHTTMTLLDQVLGSRWLRRLFLTGALVTAILGALVHSYLLLSCPLFALTGFILGYGQLYRTVANSRN